MYCQSFRPTIESSKDEDDDDVVLYCQVEIMARVSRLDIWDVGLPMQTRVARKVIVNGVLYHH